MSRNTFVGIAALLTLTVSTGYGATSTSGLETGRSVDQAITQQVCDALAADPFHYFRHVDVYVRDGVATLNGFVWDPPDIYRASELAARVPGVARVVNQMEINRFGEL